MHTDECNSIICVGQIEVFWDISTKDTIDINTEHYLKFYVLCFKPKYLNIHSIRIHSLLGRYGTANIWMDN